MMVYTIEQIRDIAAPIAASYGVKSLSIFGSYARGEATESSDVDLLVDCGAIRSAFQMGGLYADLSEGLGKELDLITTDHRDKAFLGRIEGDRLRLYPDDKQGLSFPRVKAFLRMKREAVFSFRELVL